MNRNSFVFYKDWRKAIKDLSDDVRLEIYESIIEYATTGNIQGLRPQASIAFNFAKTDLDRDIEKYRSIVERNKRNINKRWADNTKNTTGIVSIPNDTRNTDNVNDNDNVNELKEKESKKKTIVFSPPTLDDVEQYCQARNNRIDAERFINFYEAKGWMVGKNRMKNWQAAIRAWEHSRNDEIQSIKANASQYVNQTKYEQF